MSSVQQQDCLLGKEPALEGHDAMEVQKCYELICCVVYELDSSQAGTCMTPGRW